MTLYNLNYSGSDDNAGESFGNSSEEVRKKFGRSSVEHHELLDQETNTTQMGILKLLQSNPNMTADDLSKQTGVSRRAIEKNIKILKDCGRLIRHGSTKAGYWEVV